MPSIEIGTRENPELNVGNKSYIFGAESMLRALHILSHLILATIL